MPDPLPPLAGDAEALVDLLRAKAAEINELGTLPRDVVRALDDAGHYRMAIPLRYGGYAPIPVVERTRVFLALGRGNASAAWSVMNNLTNAYGIESFSDEAAREVYDLGHVGPLVAGSVPNFSNAVGVATRVDGGYRLHGRWSFASNIRLAPWLAGAVMVQAQDGSRAPLTMLVPRPDFRIADDWKVAGMAGTNSNTAFIREQDGIFVPEHRTRAMSGRLTEADAARAFLPAMLDFAAIAVGAAHGALDVFMATSQRRAPWGHPYPTIAAMPTVHAMVGLMDARLHLARTTLLDTAGAIDERNEQLTPTEVARMTFVTVLVTNQMRDLAEELRDVLGSSTAALNDPVGIYARDIATMSLHGLFRLTPYAEAHGRSLYGFEAERELSYATQVGRPTIPDYRELEETDERATWFGSKRSSDPA